MADPLPLATLTAAQRTAALARFQLLRPHLEDGVPLPRLAHAHRIPLRTLQRWLQRYRADGLGGLARIPRADRGQHRLIPQIQCLIEGLAHRTPPPTAAFVYRQVRAVAEAQGWAAPSYSTVYYVMQALGSALVTLAQEGTNEAIGIVKPQVRRFDAPGALGDGGFLPRLPDALEQLDER